MNILLVEDNKLISKGLTYALEEEGYTVTVTSTIKETKAQLTHQEYQLILLDITLPDGNGFNLYQEINKDIPIIFLTAKDSEDDIVAGFDIGATDYVTKPFSTRELLARIRRVVNTNKKNTFTVKDITFDFSKMEVSKANQMIPLTSLELKILSLLMSNPNKVITRQNIIEYIWEITGNDVYDNTITVYMKRIREKLGTDIIKTIKGIGYRIDE